MDPNEALNKIRRVLSDEIDVEEVILFGSRARGTADEGSDWDIAVVSESFEGMGFAARQRLVRPLVREALGTVPLDVACYTREEYEAGRQAFLPRILDEEGVRA